MELEKGRPIKRRAFHQPERYDLDAHALDALARQLAPGRYMPEGYPASALAQLAVEGAERLPAHGPVLFISNHPAHPITLASCVITSDVWMTLHALRTRHGRRVRLFADLSYFKYQASDLTVNPVCKALGYFPGTINNAVSVLEQGHDVLMYPEGRDSGPGYVLKDFFYGFARIAQLADVAIVPLIMLGPHEAALRLHWYGNPTFLNLQHPLPAEHRLVVMDPIRIGDFVTDTDDTQALADFCARVQGMMRDAIESRVTDSPLVMAARHLQEEYGEIHTQSARAIRTPTQLGEGIAALVQTDADTEQSIKTRLVNPYKRKIKDIVDHGYYQGSQFRNVGLWLPATVDPVQACHDLIDFLLAGIGKNDVKVLDVACGRGASTQYLLNRFPRDHVTAFDIVGDFSALWSEDDKTAKISVMDATEMIYSDASFDVVLCIESAYLFKSRQQLLQEVRRVLKPGGYFLASDFLLARRGGRFGSAANVSDAPPVDTLGVYRTLLTALQFDDIEVLDHTSQYKDLYLNSYDDFTRNAHARGELTGLSRYFFVKLVELLRRLVHHYVLIKARKPLQ